MVCTRTGTFQLVTTCNSYSHLVFSIQKLPGETKTVEPGVWYVMWHFFVNVAGTYHTRHTRIHMWVYHIQCGAVLLLQFWCLGTSSASTTADRAGGARGGQPGSLVSTGVNRRGREGPSNTCAELQDVRSGPWFWRIDGDCSFHGSWVNPNPAFCREYNVWEWAGVLFSIPSANPSDCLFQ